MTRPRERSAGSAHPLWQLRAEGRLPAVVGNRDVPKEQRGCIGDRLRFFERCRATGIATPPILMVLDRGNILLLEHDDRELPPVGLFIKPVRDTGRNGAEFWHCTGHGWTRGKDWLDVDALLERALERSHRGAVIIQPALHPHPALAPLGRGGMPTARIITIVNGRGEIEVGGAALRMPVGSDTATAQAGSIAAAIDLRTGRLGPATGLGPGKCDARHERHPATDAAIAGVILPHWPVTAALACEAHARMNERTIIGWEVAILEHGPTVLEGSGRPDVSLLARLQRCADR